MARDLRAVEKKQICPTCGNAGTTFDGEYIRPCQCPIGQARCGQDWDGTFVPPEDRAGLVVTHPKRRAS